MNKENAKSYLEKKYLANLNLKLIDIDHNSRSISLSISFILIDVV